ncbi:MAG: crossover junction endodeoxyribonuclease RuvC [Deltaproteobacteria bacterium]|nr:crossover junction endodeoxyribonuclease RuvC [Deltaproteobacteria bacterium]
MIVCGIDPGTRYTGYGILNMEGSKYSYISHGTIASKERVISERLKTIFFEITRVLKQYCPQEMAIETSFYAVNAQSALKLGQVRGVIILAATLLDIPIFEYSPTEVKKATCAYGRAGKAQVSAMVKTILNLSEDSISSRDATDALAIGLCHLSSRRFKGILR